MRSDILRILEDVVKFVKLNDYIALKDLSNHTIHNASIFQDEDSVAIAVIVYALSKIMERVKLKKKSVKGDIVSTIQRSMKLLKEARIDKYRQEIKKLLEIIAETDSSLRLYIEEVISQAEIKKGSKLYEHGISIARAAEILSISQWELMSYIGKTRIVDVMEEKPTARERLRIAREIFNIK